jgi:hypothetical protein
MAAEILLIMIVVSIHALPQKSFMICTGVLMPARSDHMAMKERICIIFFKKTILGMMLTLLLLVSLQVED